MSHSPESIEDRVRWLEKLAVCMIVVALGSPVIAAVIVAVQIVWSL